MTTPPKQTKANAIIECALAIGNFYEVPADHIVSRLRQKGRRTQNARSLLTWHLYACGMSFDAIGRILGYSPNTVRRMESAGALSASTGAIKALVGILPRIPTTMTTTGVSPVTDA